ncbi:MAG: DUF3820 family protein [Chlamydiae bacterium]|nr:DUF3820 family protein [Chlamydiota bacterium]
MKSIEEEIFICLDCETTGLDPVNDRIIEIAFTKFTFKEILHSYETLIDPECDIPAVSTEIHHITNEMVQSKPKIKEVLPHLFQSLDDAILVGHGISMDLAFLQSEAARFKIGHRLSSFPVIDTLRLARLYGESPANSLEQLRQHFNIEDQGAHRAMSDVVVNIEVFKFLSQKFSTIEQIFDRLTKPILLKTMPFGKHKGRPFSELPLEYLKWASSKSFDQDLTFSITNELKKRKKGNLFKQAANPFSSL